MARTVYNTTEEDNDDDNLENVHLELQVQSRELYTNFLHEEIQSNGLDMPASLTFEQNVRFSNPLWLCNATNLRQIANEFSHSPLRNLVRMRAQSVDLLSLNSQNFSEMIQEVFSGGGVTQEQVLVVFYFCSDVALYALQNHAIHIFHQLIQWSTNYITGRMSLWVHEQGGWGSILNNSMNSLLKISATAACCVAIVAMLVFIKKNWN